MKKKRAEYVEYNEREYVSLSQDLLHNFPVGVHVAFMMRLKATELSSTCLFFKPLRKGHM